MKKMLLYYGAILKINGVSPHVLVPMIGALQSSEKKRLSDEQNALPTHLRTNTMLFYISLKKYESVGH